MGCVRKVLRTSEEGAPECDSHSLCKLLLNYITLVPKHFTMNSKTGIY